MNHTWHSGANLKKTAPLIAAMAAVLVFHLQPLFGQTSFYDVTAFHYDMIALGNVPLELTTELHQTGFPPLWYSPQNMGSPMLGLYLPSLAHPLVVLLFHFQFMFSLALILFVTAELTVIFGYLTFTRAGASPFGSALAALLTAVTGFVPWAGMIYPVMLPVPFMLCWIWSAAGIAREAKVSRFLWNAFSVFMILMSGDAQMTVEGAYILGAWFLLWAWFAGTGSRGFAKTVVILCAAAGVGWMLSQAQMLPAILCFSKVITTRAPELSDYAATFPKVHEFLLALPGLASRQFRALFIPFSAVALFAIAAGRRRDNPWVMASLIMGAGVAVLAGLGRHGLAAVPFNLPMLKLFFRHYKIGVILQGPLMLIVAFGFDEIVRALHQHERRWIVIGLVFFALTLIVLPDNASRLAIGGMGALLLIALWRGMPEKVVKGVLFALLIVDVGATLVLARYPFKVPEPDPIYREYVNEASPHYRVLGMYPWISRAAHGMDFAVPVHGTGYFNEHSMDSWLEYPQVNLAYFLAAIDPEVADINDGVFSNVNFARPFKSSDFINERNRHLVNLAAIRYLFLQDMMLSEADRKPILSDPEYVANPERIGAFKPFQRDDSGLLFPGGRPVLLAFDEGSFSYHTTVGPGESFESKAAWETKSVLECDDGRCDEPVKEAGWVLVGVEMEKGNNDLLFARAAVQTGSAEIRADFDVDSKTSAEMVFAVVPNTHDVGKLIAAEWFDPTVIDPSKTIRFQGGREVLVYDNSEAFERVRVVHRSRVAGSNQEAMEIMSDPDQYDPAVETLLMNADAPATAGPAPGYGEGARILSYRNSVVEVSARLDSPGWLVLSDTEYPGWEARLANGDELRIYRADLNLRAVKLPAGEHLVTMRYLPADFRIGLLVSVTSFILFSIVLIFVLKRRPVATAGGSG